MCKKNIYRLCNVKQLEQDIKSRCNLTHTSNKMHENWSVLYCKSDMHVRPVRFSNLCTPTDSVDKAPLMCSTILLCLFASKYDINRSRLNYSTVSSKKIKYIDM